MQASQTIRIGEFFTPVPQLRTLYFAYLLLFLVLVTAVFITPVALFGNILAFAVLDLAILLPAAFVAWWIPRYYRSMIYRLTDTEMTWRRGVWFRRTGIVPYNRITNLDIVQGPLMRMLSVSTLRIQTAGYSGQQAGSPFGGLAEITIQGIQDAEELREMILGFVHGTRPVATGSDAGIQAGGAATALLSEVKAIRGILETLARK
ncbi:MAG: PH domain-containing protein [Methanomicrobiales archaeon]|nr:PH domain-containing protein [Methanomicrobiales archaeon]